MQERPGSGRISGLPELVALDGDPPEPEEHADDVECGRGAVVGRRVAASRSVRGRRTAVRRRRVAGGSRGLAVRRRHVPDDRLPPRLQDPHDLRTGGVTVGQVVDRIRAHDEVDRAVREGQRARRRPRRTGAAWQPRPTPGGPPCGEPERPCPHRRRRRSAPATAREFATRTRTSPVPLPRSTTVAPAGASAAIAAAISRYRSRKKSRVIRSYTPDARHRVPAHVRLRLVDGAAAEDQPRDCAQTDRHDPHCTHGIGSLPSYMIT